MNCQWSAIFMLIWNDFRIIVIVNDIDYNWSLFKNLTFRDIPYILELDI